MGERTPQTSTINRLAVAFGAAALVALGACSSGSGDDDAAATASEAADEVDSPGTAQVPAATDASDAGDRDTGGIASTGQLDLGSIGRDVAIEMRVDMTTTDLRSTVDGIIAAAALHGGGVASAEVDYGDEARDGHALLVVKVPPDSLPAVLSGLDRFGDVTSLSQDAVDVTEQLIDLDVQIRNARESVDRVRELLDEATDLRAIVEIEGDLTERQTRLERLEATQRNVEERVALSTLTIDVAVVDDVAPTAAADEEDDGIADAFAAGWDAFVGSLFAIAFVLAVLTPFLVVALGVAVVGWLFVRPRRWRGRPADDDVTGAPPADAVTTPDRESASRPG